jgi:hypothetical protein
MNHQHLAVGQEVTFVGDDKKNHKGKITMVVNGDVARIEFENGGSATASCSDKPEPGTFHFEQASPKEEHKKH